VSKAWLGIWERLTEAERRQAVRAHLEEMAHNADVSASVLKYLAAAHRTRPEAVARWTHEQRIDRLSRTIGDTPEQLLPFMLAFFVKCRSAMIRRFLDAAEIPHINGVVDVRTATTFPVEALQRGVEAVTAEFEPRDVALYLDALALQHAPTFTHVREARRRAAAATGALPEPSRDGSPLPAAIAGLPVRPAGATPTPRHVPQAGTDATEGPTEPYFANRQSLTALDDMVTAWAVSAAMGIEGAPPLPHVRLVVEELVRLNGERHRSHYHLGFLDAIEGRDLGAGVERASDRQRGWYLVGAAHAFARRGDLPSIRSLFDALPADARRILGGRHEATDVGALPFVEALLAGGLRREALEALTPHAVDRGGPALMERLLEEALACLRLQRTADATHVLRLLSEGMDAHARRDLRLDEGFVQRVKLRRALAMRLEGAFDRARAAYEELLPSGDPTIAAEAALGLALTECRVRSFTDVRLPARAADLAATARRLEPARAGFLRALEGGGSASLAAELGLGTLALAEGRGADALAHLERAVAATPAPDAIDEGHAAFARARVYLGLALAESLDAGRAAEAVEHLVAGSAAWPEEAHPHLLHRALFALATTRPNVAAQATRALYDVIGDRLLDAALDAGLLPTHEMLREALAVRAESANRVRRLRGDDAEALLRDALRAGDRGRSERALSVLEDLSDDTEGRLRLLRLLEDRSRYDPAWGVEEALYARVRLLEAEGDYAAAAALLTQAGHEILSREPERGLFAVEDLVGRIRTYGVEIADTALLRRVEALRPPTPEAPPRSPECSIYFVGGNEVQERYEEWLRAEAIRRWPQVTLTFEFTGWSSNWGRSLDLIERRIAESDAVVLMRFVRTMLGRAVRASCSEHGVPWIPCTGHGRESLLGAIEQAVLLADGAR
jgi:tetratricopeptide (TPR) repeat protein